MLSYLKGTVLENNLTYLIVQTGGVGYKVFVTPDLLGKQRGDEVAMYTHLKVAEDGQSLYGVADFDSLKLFELLITVSGVGPKVALGVLSALPAGTVRDAIASQDAGVFTRISGIGSKTAERIILDLKGKVGPSSGGSSGVTGEVFDALIALGYNQREVREIVGKLDGTKSAGEQIKHALQLLSR
jgi:Holliday junction DNA helicase RuvA